MGLGTHTLGVVPSFFMGIPVAPGNVPKYSSKERFSWTIMTTCLIFDRPASCSGVTAGYT